MADPFIRSAAHRLLCELIFAGFFEISFAGDEHLIHAVQEWGIDALGVNFDRRIVDDIVVVKAFYNSALVFGLGIEVEGETDVFGCELGSVVEGDVVT